MLKLRDHKAEIENNKYVKYNNRIQKAKKAAGAAAVGVVVIRNIIKTVPKIVSKLPKK